ncbi:GATA zinc finger-domain-containing protein [Phycomyces nitens]|nr:GATA zinc finger-domain-containing protein [Phycomyces nitens]
MDQYLQEWAPMGPIYPIGSLVETQDAGTPLQDCSKDLASMPKPGALECMGNISTVVRHKHLQECSNCKTTKTPLWRRTPDRLQSLCNACGLYFRQYGQHRSQSVRTKSSGPLWPPPEKIDLKTPDQSRLNVHTLEHAWKGDGIFDQLDKRVGFQGNEKELEISIDRSQSRDLAEIPLEPNLDSRFITLVSRMDRDQMEAFLDMLEKRCRLLRSVLTN